MRGHFDWQVRPEAESLFIVHHARTVAVLYTCEIF